MDRKPLLETLERYLAKHPEDRVRVDHVRQFVRQHEDCFLRGCAEGHITGSACVLSHDRARALLVHHRKLARWLQPGGHADGHPLVQEVALREAREETALDGLKLAEALPLDVDVHLIPALDAEPAHLHHDIRYLVLAPPEATPHASDESHEVRWFTREEIEREITEESLLRMARRAW
jgi:8-oxo-dGTP pyrophosphatase MutT (NUDIX family)